MALNWRKRLSTVLLTGLAVTTMMPSIALGGKLQSPPPAPKDKPFASEQESTSMRLFSAASSFDDGNVGNESLRIQVGSDGRFNAGLRERSEDGGWYNIMYSWPSYPSTSFTTLRVNGQDFIYGNNYDELSQFISPPQNNEEGSLNHSLWKTGDITVSQSLQAGINPGTGLPDAMSVRYVITNTGTTPQEVGLRMMLDTMINGNDYAPFKVPGTEGIESIDYERDYTGSDVPSYVQVFDNFEYPDISAQFSLSGRDATLPDRFTIANWGRIQATQWDYETTPDMYTGDSAVGLWWNPKLLAPGEQRVITTYYGVPGVSGESSLVLSGRQRLSYEEWTSKSFDLISYLTNQTGGDYDNVVLKLQVEDGLTLVNGDAEHPVGTVAHGTTVESSWKLRATKEGKHKATVEAYADGSSEAFAQASFVVEALKPAVPSNVSLGGTYGTSPTGTPIAGRLSPITIQASYNNPQAVSVNVTVTDSNGVVHEAVMTTSNQIDWEYTFVPSSVGLWGSPMTINLTPVYADGTTGPEQEFPIELIDPSGFIYHKDKGEDWKLPEATVILQYYDPSISTWVQMSEEAYPGHMSPTTNPQVTGKDGHYGWDAAAGTYRVVVSRPGFETTTSYDVTIPPPVMDLHVGLKPTDFTPPVVEVSGAAEGATYSDPVAVSFTTSDNAAGVRFNQYQINGEEAVTTEDSVVTLPEFTQLGSYTIVFTSVDHAGNEKQETLTFSIQAADQVAPTTSVLVNNAAPASWYNTDGLTVKLEGTDNQGGSGVDKTYYSVNGGAVKTYSGPFLLSGAGSYSIKFYSVDRSGNVEIAQSITLGVDKVAPLTKYTLTPVWDTKNGVKYIKGYTFTLTAKDDKSGVKETYYRVNGGAWKLYTGPFQVLNGGNRTVEFYSVDRAGNMEKFKVE